MRKAIPAIDREFTDDDREAEVIATPMDDVSFTRGLGDQGRRYEVVEMDCPRCSMDRLIRQWRVNPVDRDTVSYYCLNPACPHYHEEKFDFVGLHTPRASEPAVSD